MFHSTCRRSFVSGRAQFFCALLAIVVLLAGSCRATLAQAAAAGQAKSDNASTVSASDLDQAKSLLSTSHWNDAAPLVQSYLVQHPESADAHALMGLILYRQHQPRESMKEFMRESELADLSAFDLRVFALDCAAIPDLPEAEKWLQRSLDVNDQDAATWEALGHVRFSSQHYESTIEALNRALEIAPRTVSSEALIGLANERLAHLDAAEAAYRQAIAWQADREVKDSIPFVGLGRVLLNNNQPQDAIPFLQVGAKAPQPSSEAHELLGLAYSKTGRNGEAAAELEAAIRIQPHEARLHLMLGRIYRTLGAKEKADAEQAQYAKLKESAAP
ncbi:tetratricopeptide repeat protein [Terracidiphilus gabretensis]|uniref:tetratricopeptide repeat protein n=1 Tax=Terracidiphilus gabretensis TaxID=1577687 RepID=UPI00071BB002|nr:tetratricopeptide repeat protein [Terracidiphilus gabretensis]